MRVHDGTLTLSASDLTDSLACERLVGLARGVAEGAIPPPIYFWGSVAATISAPGQPPAPEVIRPTVIGIFADGSWDLQGLRWTGWGSSVAHAVGISSASNGIPNMAQGKRITPSTLPRTRHLSGLPMTL